MGSSKRPGRLRPIAAAFADVTPHKHRLPSWLAQRYGGKPSEPPSIAPAPRVPGDFPLGGAGAARSPGRSPSGSQQPGRTPSSLRPTRASARPSITASDLAELHAERGHVQEQLRQTEALQDGMSRAIAELADARRELLDDSASRLVELCEVVTRRVIARELATNPAIIEGLVAEGLAALSERSTVRIRLGPGFAESLPRVEQQLATRGISGMVSVDEALPDHGCHIETDIGRVDESVDERLKTLLAALDPEEH